MTTSVGTHLETARPEEPQTVSVVCQPFGNRCNICGYFFGEGDDICSGAGHVIGQVYRVPKPSRGNPEPEKPEEPEKPQTVSVVCQPFGNRCNICGSFFGEGDDVCGGAGCHIIGQEYPVRV